jgi:hypothetical protein
LCENSREATAPGFVGVLELVVGWINVPTFSSTAILAG